jgi:DivIVA domain-containing protein
MALTPEQVLNKHFQTTQFRRGYEERDVDDFLDEVVAEMRSLIEQRDDYLKQLNDCRASKNQTAVRGADASGVLPAVRPGDEAKLAGLNAKIQDAERAFRAASERATKAKADADNAERLARERVERAEQAAQSSVDAASLNDAQARLTALNSKVSEAEERLARSEEAARAAEEAARAAEERAAAASAQQQPVAAPAAAAAAAAAPTGGTDAAEVIALAQKLHDEHVRNGVTKRDELIGAGQQKHDELVGAAQGRHEVAN